MNSDKVLRILAAHVGASMCPQDQETLNAALAEKPATQRVARSAVSGQIVTAEEAAANPATTVTQKVRKPAKRKAKK